jgi:hypothetical protein
MEVAVVIRSVPTPVLAGRLRQVLTVDASDALRRCSAPVAYLAATRDRVLGDRGIASVRRARPDTECVRIEGPHLLLQVSSRQAARVIGSFTERWLAH